MNRVTLLGRLTSDLELRSTASGKDIVSYTLAVRRDSENTDFINCATFGEFAKTLHQYCHKGDMIGVDGRLQISQYEKDGKKYTSYSVISEKVDFANIKKEDSGNTTQSFQSISQDEIVLEDSELPF